VNSDLVDQQASHLSSGRLQQSHQTVRLTASRKFAFRPDRRGFLRAAGAGAVMLLPLRAAWASTPSRRSLSFVHTHTGEQMSTVYFQNGQYRPLELVRINQLLRDFRTGDVHPIDPAVLDILADLRVLADRDEPYEVISGYRSSQTNAALRSRSSGVAEHSLHLEGRAIDVRLPGVATRRLRELAVGMGRGGVGFYARSDFVHLDNGRVRYW
jgi:uncharacterized protein YcbK (DUF882 family)